MPPSVDVQTANANNMSATKESKMVSTVNGSSSHRSNGITSSRVAVLQRIYSELLSECEAESLTEVTGHHTCQTFLDWSANQRLREMPHDGGRWDQVLKWAEYFASQTFDFRETTEHFIMAVDSAESLALGACLQLLKLGASHVNLLSNVFGVLYEMSLHLDFYGRWELSAGSSNKAKQLVAYAYGDLLKYVVHAAIHLTRGHAHGVDDFERLFGATVRTFYGRKAAVVDCLWQGYIERERSELKYEYIDLDTLRSFLAPQDVNLASVKAALRATRRNRSERSCTWFNSHLRDFNVSSDKMMHITGPAGSGKTYLSAWIEEKLRNNAGVHAYNTITYFVNPDFQSDSSPITVLKGLVSQALEYNIGNIAVWNAVSEAVVKLQRGGTTHEVEEKLWKAFELALESAGKIMVLVDGVDYLADQPHGAVHFLSHLHSAVSKSSQAKALVTSGPLQKAVGFQLRSFRIEAALVQADIFGYVGSVLATTSHFRGLSHRDKQTIMDKISRIASGSFVWADLALQLLKAQQQTLKGVLEAIDNLPKTTEGLIEAHVATLNLRSSDTRALLAWLVGAARPLRISEVKALFEIDTTTCTHVPRLSRVDDDIVKCLGNLVDLSAGVIRFRNSVLKWHITKLAKNVTDFSNTGSFPFNIQEAHYDLTIRSLAYVKINLTRYIEPTFDLVDNEYLVSLFEDYTLLEYSTRYWMSHFRSSPMVQSDGHFKLTGTIKLCFPNSTLLSLVESTIFKFSHSAHETLILQRTAYELRKEILSSTSTALLQSLAFLAVVQSIVIKTTEINEYFYQAYTLSRKVLGKYNLFSTHCATRYVATITTKFTSRTEIATRKEELLLYIVESYKQTYGVTHDVTIKYYEELSEFYIQIEHYESALTVQQELYEIYIEKYGQSSTRTTTVYERLVQTMRKTSKSTTTTSVVVSNYELAQRTMSVTDTRRFTLTKEVITMYESQQNFAKAEETLVQYWRSLSVEASSTKTETVRVMHTELTLDYVRFLKRRGRTDEASSILQGYVSEFQSTEITTRSETQITKFKEVGEEMKSMSLWSAAKTVFSSVWSYYKKSGKQTTKEATSVATSYAETVRHTKTTRTDETFLREVLTTTTSSTETTSTSLHILVDMTKTYVSKSEWSEAIQVARDGLLSLWPSVIKDEKSVQVPKHHRDELVSLTQTLAHCYYEIGSSEESEKLYVAIFRASKNSVDVHDTLFTTSHKHLVEFYEKTYQYDSVARTREDLVSFYSHKLGKTSTLTTKARYTLAEFYSHHRRTREAERTYVSICEAYDSKHTEVIHTEAVSAAESLCIIYEKERRWDMAQKTYYSLSQTIIKKSKETKFSSEFINKVNERYLHILKHEITAEFSVVRQAAQISRKTSYETFGSTSEAYISSSLQLAEISEEREETRSEAMSIYEEVYRTSQTTSTSWSYSTLSIIAKAKHKLASMYSKKEVYTETATSLYREEFESTRSTMGISSSETMTWFSQLITAYSKQTETTKKQATTMLTEYTLEISRTVRDTEQLHSSATTLARLYTVCGYKSRGLEIVHELREQVVFGEKSSDRKLQIFVVAFEATLVSGSFSEIMADLMTEVLYYETYQKNISIKASYQVTLVSGIRLLLFLRTKNRTQETKRIHEELIKLLSVHLRDAPVSNTTILSQFLDICITVVSENEDDLTVIYTGTESVFEHIDASRFQAGYDLAVMIERFTKGHFSSNQAIAAGFKLVMYLTGHGTKTCQDTKLYQSMLDLSRIFLAQVFIAIRSIKAKLTQFSIKELDTVAVILGQQQNFEDLEWLLTTLWDSRHTQQTWTSGTIIEIGRRLAETRFVRDNREGALRIAVDMHYNLRRVWGTFDATTLETGALLTALYSSSGQHAAAQNLHEDVLRLLLDEEGDELPPSDAASIAVRNLELLKRAYQRLGRWEKPAQAYTDLFNSLSNAYSSEKTWQTANLTSPAKWSAKGADSVGLWTQPQTFSFLSEASAGRKHENHLRRSTRGWSSASPTSSTGSFGHAGAQGQAHAGHVGRTNGAVAV